MKKLLIAVPILVISMISGCTNSKDANRALDDAGFTNIQMTGYAWFACSKDDFYHSGFLATNTNGKQVKGTVCSGFWFKNSIIRYD